MNLLPNEIQSNVEAYRAILKGRWREVEYADGDNWYPMPERRYGWQLQEYRLRVRPVVGAPDSD